MKVSKILLAVVTTATAIYAIRKIAGRKALSAAVNDILFDTEFLPGTRKINQFIPDNPEMRNWFRTRQYVHDGEEALFI